jgi:hypothetical protein
MQPPTGRTAAHKGNEREITHLKRQKISNSIYQAVAAAGSKARHIRSVSEAARKMAKETSPIGLVHTFAAETDSPLVRNSLNSAFGVVCETQAR